MLLETIFWELSNNLPLLFSGDVEKGDEIIFCDHCDVAVHQMCYGVKVVPEGGVRIVRFADLSLPKPNCLSF